jgi:hypothetical protein
VTLAGPLSRIDLTDLDNFAAGFPHDLFEVHRREAPVYWHEPTDNTPDGEGFWSVATHAETLAVLRDPETYSSVTGGERPYGGTLLQDLAIAGQVLNMMDDPRHSQIRRLVSSGLTPRMIRRVEDDLRGRARRLLDGLEPGSSFDFLVEVAAELPMQMICILLGIPESERHWLFEAIEPNFDFGGSRKASISRLSIEEAGSRIYNYGQELIASKRAAPTDDMLSVVANASLDTAVSDAEVYLFFNLLFSAGAETTRNSVASGLLALAEHPISWPRCVRIWSCCRPRSRRWCAGRRRRRRSGAPPLGRLRSAGTRSRPETRCWCGRGRPTATRRCSTARRASISAKAEPALGLSGRGCTTAWRQPGAAGAAGAVRGTARPVLVGGGGQAGGVDPEQPHTGIRHLVVELGRVRPDAFAAVMATGIVSIAAEDHSYHVISDCAAVSSAMCCRAGCNGTNCARRDRRFRLAP